MVQEKMINILNAFGIGIQIFLLMRKKFRHKKFVKNKIKV
jgi:hypothetical protein